MNLPKDQKPIDFSPLDGLQKSYNITKEAFILAGVFLIFFGGPMIFALASLFPSAISFVVVLGAYGLLIGIGWKYYQVNQQKQRHNKELLEEFARINDMSYQEAVIKHTDKKPGTLFYRGHSKKISRVLSGQLHNLPFELFQYNYETGSGKSRRTYDAHIAEITLPRTMPHMVIDSLVEGETDTGASTLPINFDKSQKIELEGDFHKYFSLYAPDKYGVSALTILAPDAMETLMRHAALCDIEIIDNKMYFYWPKVAKERNDYENALTTVMEILDEMGDKLTRDDIFSTHSQKKVHTQSARGVRLKRPKFTFLTGIIITVFVAGIFIGTQNGSLNVYLIVAQYGVFLFAIFAVLYRNQKRKRLRKELERRYGRS